jgi:predicted Rossmann fold flavoprotein
MNADVLVIGGGASGMTAAIKAAETGADVAIIEKKEQMGKKLLTTGNGRCNLLNSDRSPKHFHSSDPKKACEMLDALSNKDILDHFAGLGVLCRETEGYYYPYSNQALTVNQAFNKKIKELGINVLTGCEAKKIEKKAKGFKVICADRVIDAKTVIISAGSPAGLNIKEKYTGLGLLDGLNIKTKAFSPALTALLSGDKCTQYWSGVRCEALISIADRGEILRSEKGELMLAPDGISGIAAYQLSHYVKDGCCCLIDFAFDRDEKELFAFFRSQSSRTLQDILEGMFALKLAKTLCMEVCFRNAVFKGIKPYEARLDTDEKIKAAISTVKEFKVNITGLRGFGESQVAKGGILLDETDENCMIKKCPGLFACGEILDFAGDCGGYNLMWAWTTGIKAGTAAGRYAL